MKRFLILLVTMLLCIAPAYAAEDVFTVDAQSIAEDAWDESFIASSLTSDRSYLRVTSDLVEDAQVTLSIAGENGSLVYQRDYGVCSGRFRSEDIYLRLTGSQTTYHVSLWIGDSGYSFPLRRVMPRLTGNAACSVGYPLDRLSGANTWKSATLLDVNALEGSSLTVPLHASGAYEIGTVTFTVSGGSLTVSAAISDGVDGSIDQSTVYVATTALEAEKLGKKNFPGITTKLNKTVDLQGTPYAAVYVNLTVSFSPADVPGSPAVTLDGQDATWQRMLTETANEAIG